MCNRFAALHSLRNIEAFASMLNLQLSADDILPRSDIFPDTDVPVLRRTGDTLSCSLLRWGLPPIPGQSTPITNIRNLESRWWQETNAKYCLQPQYRCLVPFSAFAEPAHNSTWFTTNSTPACFAGIWQPWQGERLARLAGHKKRIRIAADWQLFAFLTCEANALVRPVHDTMPVVLTSTDAMKRWLAGGAESFDLQRPLADNQLHIMSETTPEPHKIEMPTQYRLL